MPRSSYEGDVKRIFDHFMMADAGNAMSAGSDAMNYREFTLLLKAANLFDARLTQQAAKLVFAHSQMVGRATPAFRGRRLC